MIRLSRYMTSIRPPRHLTVGKAGRHTGESGRNAGDTGDWNWDGSLGNPGGLFRQVTLTEVDTRA